MAFRIGHQITCNINKKLYFRSSSLDSSRQYRSPSFDAYHQRLNENCCLLVKDKKINIPRTRSLPSPEDSFNVITYRRFSSKQPASESEKLCKDGHTKDTTSISESASAPYTKVTKIKFEPKTSNTGLQPSKLTPIASTCIHYTSPSVPEASRSVKIDKLRHSASVQYERALKALYPQSEDEVQRYQLEAAKPRTEKDASTPNMYQLYKKKYQTVTAQAPQLQPKNIKPYGNINTIPWCAPNVEYSKQGIVIQNKKRNRYQQSKTKRNKSEDEASKSQPNYTQQREYCTVQGNAQLITPELEKCKAIIAEYKKINPEYTEKKSKLIPGSEEEKKFIEQTEKFIANLKNKHKNNELLESKTGMPAETSSIIPIEKTIEGINRGKRELQNVLDITTKFQPKVNLQHPTRGKVILYYEEKHGNKILCSKVIKEENADNVDNSGQSLSNLSEKESLPIKVKVGPKLMLQSTNLTDGEYRLDQLTPAANEKFITPWLSWGDRIKQYEEYVKNKIAVKKESITIPSFSAQDTSRKKSNTTFATSTITDTSVNKQREIQKREFCLASNMSLQDPLLTGEEYYWMEMWNKSNGSLRADEILKKKSDKMSLTSISNRFFSTNSTRGVLGPEGTVMVKLRRLPKINIPEPPKVCPLPCHKQTIRADGIVQVKPKKLPKLVPFQCPPPSKIKMKDVVPLGRPKCRGVPPEPPRICPKPCKFSQKRADDGLKIFPKKLPAIRTADCFPCLEQKMTSPLLPRLKPRPLPPPPPCKDIFKEICPPRADEGFKVTRKRLPPLKMSDCCPVCKPQLIEGEPLKRLKKVFIPEPKHICVDAKDACPPRADDIFGYTVKKKKLQTLILSEKNNNVSWREFNSRTNSQSRNYTTDSKCNMCCYSDKKVHPDIKMKSEVVPSELDKFEGQLLSRDDGKIRAYLPPDEVVDTSTGSVLKIIKKPIGKFYREDERLHVELLKSGFTTFNNSERKFSSMSSIYNRQAHKASCSIPPDKTPLKDLRLKPLKKRKNFDEDFPPRIRFSKAIKEKECINPCTEPRMDDIMKYEVKQKSLPVLPKGKCLRKENPVPKMGPPLLRRLKKMRSGKQDCPKMCEEKCPPRADDNLIETPKRLPPMIMSNCPQPEPKRARDDDSTGFKRLPKFTPIDPPKCKPPECPLGHSAPRSDAGKNLYERKSLPALKPSDCRPKPPPKLTTRLKIPRLPKPPFSDRIDDCRTLCEKIRDERTDIVNNYQVKKKKLKVILKSSNKSFSTLPNNFMYHENFSRFDSNRYISLNTHLLNSDKKECKKLSAHQPQKKCPKYKLAECRPVKNTSCKRRRKDRIPCTKLKSPYPSFSECKDHEHPDILTECKESERHLQPRWPILNEIVNQKPPPPYQGKIDPKKEEECIARKLNIETEGETKTCDNFDKPYEPLVSKQMYDEVMKNPPYDECECANESNPTPPPESKGPCRRVVRDVCPDPEIECTLGTKPQENLSCNKHGEDKEIVNEKSGDAKDKPKLTCRKKSSKGMESKENEKNKCREVKSTCKGESTEGTKKADKKEQRAVAEQERKEKCKQPETKKCEQKIDKECEAKKKECESQKATKDKVSKKDSCRNVKACKKKKTSQKVKPKKCSDLLKEDKTEKPTVKKAAVADLCGKKPCTPKASKEVPVKKAASCPAVPPKCPAKKGLLERILDFFRARPNCPPPDQWKKDKLKKKAEKAAAAAGYELCEKKKPKIVKVVCKKTGIRNAVPSSKLTEQRRASKGCKKLKQSCSSTPKKDYSTNSKGNEADECKIASVVKAKECLQNSEKECIQEEPTERNSGDGGSGISKGGKKCKLPKQKYCKPPARKSCKEDIVAKKCTTVEAPYPSYSECRRRFPRLAITECTEQERNKKHVTFDYDDPKKTSRSYSTTAIQKRFYSNNANDGKNYDAFTLFNINKDSLKDMENNELALRILTVVKEGMKSMALTNHNASETYYNIFKELESLCEEEINKNIKKEIISDLDNKYSNTFDSLSDIPLSYKKAPPNQKAFLDLEETIMIEAIKNFCKTVSLVPDLSTQSYEESERIKTEKLQKKLDDILDNYKIQ